MGNFMLRTLSTAIIGCLIALTGLAFRESGIPFLYFVSFFLFAISGSMLIGIPTTVLLLLTTIKTKENGEAYLHESWLRRKILDEYRDDEKKRKKESFSFMEVYLSCTLATFGTLMITGFVFYLLSLLWSYVGATITVIFAVLIALLVLFQALLRNKSDKIPALKAYW